MDTNVVVVVVEAAAAAAAARAQRLTEQPGKSRHLRRTRENETRRPYHRRACRLL